MVVAVRASILAYLTGHDPPAYGVEHVAHRLRLRRHGAPHHHRRHYRGYRKHQYEASHYGYSILYYAPLERADSFNCRDNYRTSVTKSDQPIGWILYQL